ncbi:MAG TPA: HDOD domain-containing protein, partial [Rhodocyclaceae bacterium]|nr:HDOD domain-containing protein [Rhodocyclaceae bacterium]
MLVQADMERTTAAPENPRFRLLEDIAREMSGSVIFPTTFDLVVRLRKVLEDPNVSLDRIAEILNLEPLIAVRLVGLANSAAYRRRGPEARDLKTAIQRLGLRSVRSAALAIALGQLIRSKDM